MCLALCAVDSSTIEAVLTDPPLVWKVIAPDDEEAYESSRPDHRSFLSRMLGRPKAQRPVAPKIPAPSATTDLDKAWHGIHYLLTGTAWDGEPPLNFLVHGGREIGSIDVGYGPARAMTADEVCCVYDSLLPLSAEELRARFDPQEMMRIDIYPQIWDRDPTEDDTLGYCLEFYSELKGFLGSAAAANHGVILYLA